MPTEDSVPILPESARELIERITCGSRHPGLQLDKLSPVGDGTMGAQKDALKKVATCHTDNILLKSLLARRNTILDTLSARRLTATTRGLLTLHLSRSGAMENAGIALHPIYGFVYLPGSGIKGLVRSWAETVWAPTQPDRKAAWQKIEQAFGWSPHSEDHKFPQPRKGLSGWRPSDIKPQPGSSAGRLVFHEAWPTRWPRLILDVVNNHHVKYYAGEDDPGDWEDPTLVYFLAVGRGEEFEFAISDRRPANDALLATACGWLREALVFEGAGAKTAAGYGRFEPIANQQASIPGTLTSATYALRLVSPAFLAGADQKREDCDLRPATLRGLLRWWWRTMHAAHLDRATLKKLETAVWGDAQSGSPVRITVDSGSDEAPLLYDYKDGFSPKSEFKCLNDLQKAPNKTTQGLFYVSYGMDDDRRTKKKRYYRPARSVWRVTLTARTGWFESGKRIVLLSPETVLEQATLSLWLLTRFGGVGSRSRKGLGSLADIEVEALTGAKDCRERAQAFRQKIQIQARKGGSCSPALEEMRTCEVQTPWSNPWTALDQLGYAVQSFAQKYAHDKRKKALGLPRQIHGPLDHPMRNQNPDDHKPPLNLSAKRGKRHAAPVHYHLADSGNGKLLIRATAFPAHYLPDYRESKKMLDECLTFLDKDLKKRVAENPHLGQKSVEPKKAQRPSPPKGSTDDESNRIKRRIENLGGRGDVSKMDEIVGQIKKLSEEAARRECAQQLRKWLKGGKKSLWKDKKHANTEWRKQLNSLLE